MLFTDLIIFSWLDKVLQDWPPGSGYYFINAYLHKQVDLCICEESINATWLVLKLLALNLLSLTCLQDLCCATGEVRSLSTGASRD